MIVGYISNHITGKSLSKALFLQNMGRTFCVHKLFWVSKTISVHNMFYPCSELRIFMYWTCNSMNNLPSYCGLVDAKIRASDNDLPIPKPGFSHTLVVQYTLSMFYLQCSMRVHSNNHCTGFLLSFWSSVVFSHGLSIL